MALANKHVHVALDTKLTLMVPGSMPFLALKQHGYKTHIQVHATFLESPSALPV